MGRQAYMTRLALGRSAYEAPSQSEQEAWRIRTDINTGASQDPSSVVPLEFQDSESYIQQYDDRGHPENPESRSARRKALRAQNDVLATVGVCVSVDKNGKLIPSSRVGVSSESMESKKLREIARENESGFWLAAGNHLLFPLTTLCMEGLRMRIETFSSYNGIPFMDICSIEQNHFGTRKFLFEGLGARLLHTVIDTGRGLVIEYSHELILGRYVKRIKSRKRRKQMEKFLDWAKQIVNFAIIILISPIEIYCTLQMLNLVPSEPIIPWNIPLKTLSQFFLPAFPTTLTLRSCIQYSISLALSPIGTYTIYKCFPLVPESKLIAYSAMVLPRPENPDAYSQKITSEEMSWFEDLDNSPYMDVQNRADFRRSGSLVKEIKKDISELINSVVGVGLSWRDRLRKAFAPNVGANTKSRDSSGGLFEVTENSSSDPSRTEAPPPHPATPPVIISGTNQPLQPNLIIGESAVLQQESTSITPHLPIITTPHHSLSPSISSSDGSPTVQDLDTNIVQVTTRTGSTDTLHMNVEFNAALPGVPVFTSSFSASPRPAIVETVTVHEVTVDEPHHRVTALTTYASSSLSQLLASQITQLCMIPLEALFVRSVAQRFIWFASMSATPAMRAKATRLRADVFPMGSWLGLGVKGWGWRGVAGYVSRMVFCSAYNAVVCLAVWEYGVGTAVWLGFKYFGWGKL